MKEVLRDALIELGAAKGRDERSTIEFERRKSRNELKEDLSRYLPEQVSEVIIGMLKDC
jgi:hypothetical protein